MKHLFLLFVFLFYALLSFAQDLHFSQFFLNPQNLNPAEVGFFNGDIRANTVIRNQWKAIPVPYQTNVIALDFTKIKTIKNSNIGLVFNNDKAGDSQYTQNQILLSLSKIFKLKKDSSFLLSIALQEGFFSNSFQTSNQSFDSQFNGTLYDKNLPHGELFYTTKQHYFNTNFGSILAYRYSVENIIKAGVSVNNIAKSNLSFFKNSQIKLNQKLTIYILAEHTFNNKVFALPYVGFFQKEKNKEIILGSSFGKKIVAVPAQDIKPYVGFFFRNKDAYSIQVGSFYNQFNIALSYDVNYSKLKTATNNRGALEFSLIYIFKKPKPFLITPKFCPVFL